VAQKPWIVPIPGTRNIDHLNENLGTFDVELPAEDLREVDTALSAITVHGGRLNPLQMELVDTSPLVLASRHLARRNRWCPAG
jgi:diketogulonate reductase-like aldo/keto reductase